MKRLLIFWLVLPINCAAQPEQFTRSTMTVMAWSLAGFQRIPRDRVLNFVPAVREMDAEVLALVEVNTDWMPPDPVAELNDLGACYKRKITDQSANMCIALLHKCNVEASRIRPVPGSDDGNNSLSHIHSGGAPGNLLNGFAVSESHTTEYIKGSLRTYPMHRALANTLAEYRKYVSGHLPIVASFRITKDDDQLDVQKN